MSHTAICGVGVPATSAVCSNSDRQTHVGGAQRLTPVVGLVNRTPDVHLRTMRVQQRRNVGVRSSCKQVWESPVAKADKLKATTVTESDFHQEVLESQIPVLVDFWATWCGPCRLMGVVMDWAAQEYEGKLKCVKIETDPNPELVEKYKVYGLPTLMLFVNGQEVPGSKREGAMNKEKLNKMVAEMLPSLATTTTN